MGWAIPRRLRPYTRVVCGVGLVSPPPCQGLGFILKSVATLLNRVFELCITD